MQKAGSLKPARLSFKSIHTSFGICVALVEAKKLPESKCKASSKKSKSSRQPESIASFASIEPERRVVERASKCGE